MLRIPKLALAWARQSPPAWLSYVLAAGVVLSTALVRLMADPILNNSYPFFMFVVPLVFIAWFAGPLPTALAALLAALLSEQMFRYEQAALVTSVELMTLRYMALLAAGALCVLLSAARLPARQQARRTARTTALRSAIPPEVNAITRARLERARRLTEARLSAVVGAAMDAILLLDSDLTILVFNDSAQSMFGMPAARALGTSFLQFVPERLRDAYETRIMTHTGKAAFLTQGMETARLMAVRANGEEFPVEGTIAVIDDHGERLYEIILRDISERVQTEATLREQNERLQLALISADMGTWRWDLSSNQDTRDATLNRMLGLAPQQSTDTIEDLLERIHPNDRHRVQSLIDRALATGEVYDAEFRILQPDGSIRWLRDRGKVIFGSDGQATGMTGVVSDITERKLAEQHSARLHAFTAALSSASTSAEVADTLLTQVGSMLDNTTVAVAIAERETGALRLLGMGQSGPDAPDVGAEAVTAATSPLSEAIRTRHPVWVDATDLTAANSPAAALPFVGHSGATGGVLILFAKPHLLSEDERRFWLALAHETAVAMDRAHHFEAEQIARAEAERANTLKLKFLGMISHELRTPLTSIKGFTSTLLASDVTWGPEEQREFIRIIDSESDKLRDLVVQLLDVSSLEAGTLRIQPDVVTLQAVLDAALPQIAAVSANHLLDVSLPDDLPPVHVDSLRIGQVIVNLIDNAAKYSPPGSPIRLNARANGRYIYLSVADEGEGIPPDDRALVFEAFRQVDRKSRQRGAGLGLAICKGVLQAHGSDIWVEDGTTSGTTICFTLPVSHNNA